MQVSSTLVNFDLVGKKSSSCQIVLSWLLARIPQNRSDQFVIQLENVNRPTPQADRRSHRCGASWVPWDGLQDNANLMKSNASSLQGAVSKAMVKKLEDATLALDQALEHSDLGITFRSDAIPWDTTLVVSVTDAPFCTGNGYRA